MVIGILIGVVLLLAAGGFFFGSSDREGFGIGLAVVAMVVIGFSWGAGLATYNQRTLECTITDKDRGYNSEGSSEYRVYTEQCGTFVNQDSIFRGKFNSGDIQGQLEVGQTYELEVAGPRIPLFSMFPNIFRVSPVAN